MSYFVSEGSSTASLEQDDIRGFISEALGQLGFPGSVLAIPPDYSRRESQAGYITCVLSEYYGENLNGILPATGTHRPMSRTQIKEMFPTVPEKKFLIHNWRADSIRLGTIEAEFINDVTGGLYNEPWEAQVNKSIVWGNYDLIVSIGHVVPHEVAGMANHSKNIFIGTGGIQSINKSHYFSALYGIENILGKTNTPLRRVLNEAFTRFCQEINIIFILTVIEPVPGGENIVRGIFIGDDIKCFEAAAELSSEVNITELEKAPETIIVNLDKDIYKSTWIGNKAIYRTRMAIKDNGKLYIIAPGIETFGEDPVIDKLIRKYGYCAKSNIPSLVAANPDLQENLAVAAHLAHGHHENRFNICYCTNELSRKEIESVGYQFEDINTIARKYDVQNLNPGINYLENGEEIYYVDNPGFGLWRFRNGFS